jgi:hypothetical protein
MQSLSKSWLTRKSHPHMSFLGQKYSKCTYRFLVESLDLKVADVGKSANGLGDAITLNLNLYIEPFTSIILIHLESRHVAYEDPLFLVDTLPDFRDFSVED